MSSNMDRVFSQKLLGHWSAPVPLRYQPCPVPPVHTHLLGKMLFSAITFQVSLRNTTSEWYPYKTNNNTWKVFQRVGPGKDLTQAISQISYSTPSTRSQSWSPTSSLTAGGASRASLMASRKERRESQVSRSIVWLCWANSCTRLEQKLIFSIELQIKF